MTNVFMYIVVTFSFPIYTCPAYALCFLLRTGLVLSFACNTTFLQNYSYDILLH